MTEIRLICNFRKKEPTRFIISEFSEANWPSLLIIVVNIYVVFIVCSEDA